MADIEERAEKWVTQYEEQAEDHEDTFHEALVRAYLAGSSQTQSDYARYLNAHNSN
jgi:hypothetical protein